MFKVMVGIHKNTSLKKILRFYHALMIDATVRMCCPKRSLKEKTNVIWDKSP